MVRSLGNTTDSASLGEHHRRGQACRGLIALAAVTFIGGCNQSPYDLAPVRGTVTIDGQPFTGGKVMFAPAATGEQRKTGKPAFGLLAADGSFELTTYEEGDGAVVGEHWVTLIKLKPRGGKMEVDGQSSAPAPVGAADFARVAYPKRVTVSAQERNQIDVRFTKQDIAKYGENED
jgi:hypothetical protein